MAFQSYPDLVQQTVAGKRFDRTLTRHVGWIAAEFRVQGPEIRSEN